jgi:hypothetical protein
LIEALARYGSEVHMGLLVEILTEAMAWVQQLDEPNQ